MTRTHQEFCIWIVSHANRSGLWTQRQAITSIPLDTRSSTELHRWCAVFNPFVLQRSLPRLARRL